MGWGHTNVARAYGEQKSPSHLLELELQLL